MDNRSFLSIQLSGQDFLIDFSEITSRDGCVRIVEPLCYRDVRMDMPHLPYFWPGELYLKDGGVTSRTVDRCRQLLPSYLKFIDALNSVDIDDFRAEFQSGKGKMLMERHSRALEKQREHRDLVRSLRRSLRRETFLDNRERSCLFDLLAREGRDLDDEVFRLESEMADLAGEVFFLLTGIEVVSLSNKKMILKKLNLDD